MIDGKRRRRVVQHPGRTTAAKHGGRDKGKGARLRTVGGNIRREDRGRGGRQAGRHDEAKRFGVSEWYGCSSSRAYIYSCYI